MASTSLVLAEDHPAVALQLRELLVSEFDVLAVVSDGQALIEATRRLKPDVIVADISMPMLDGLSAARAILRDRPDICVVLITVHNDPELLRRGFDVGCRGYVLKGSAGEELLLAIRVGVAGGRFVSSACGRVFPHDSPRDGQRTADAGPAAVSPANQSSTGA